MELKNLLENLGFKDKKAKVYLACLELGESSAQEVAKTAQVERTSVYAILEALKKEGLITSSIKGKTQFFVPLPPEKLLSLFKSKVGLISENLSLFLSIYNDSNIKPKIRFYENKEGIKQVFSDSLNCSEKLTRTLSSAQDALDLMGETFLRHHIDKRVAAGIKTRSLRPQEKELKNWYLKADNEKVLRESRFLPEGFSFEVVCIIYDNRVALISSKKEHFGFIIESNEFSKLMKTLHDILWQVSKPV